MVDKENIVTFQQDQTQADVRKPAMTYEARILRTVTEDRVHTIEDFLRTPVKLRTQILSTSDMVYSPLFSFDVPEQFYSLPVFVSMLRKIANLRFFRADLVFNFKVNASKADYGRYLASWEPFGVEASQWKNTLAYNTALQNCEIVCGPAKSSSLTVPYVSPYSALDTLETNMNYGRLRFMPIQPLSSNTTGSTAQCDVFVYFENIHLSVRTDTSFAGPGSTDDPYASAWPPNFPPPGRRTPMARKHSNMKEILSGVLQGASSALGSAHVNTPSSNSNRGMRAPWIGAALKGAAEFVGLSKTQTDKPVCSLANVPGMGFTNGIGIDNSVTLGATPLNAISVDHKVFSTDQDEMDILYVISKKVWIQWFPWSTSMGAGYILNTYPVLPGLGPNEQSLPANQFNTTPMSFTASMFEYWRGSISYRFSLVKNDFYSGRFGIAFAAGLDGTECRNPALDINTLPRVICDITETNDFIVTVPYKSQSIALRTNIYDTSNKDDIDSTFSLGTLILYVETELVVPDQLSPPIIPIQTYVGAGPDLKFGVPNFARFGILRYGDGAELDGVPLAVKQSSALLREMAYEKTEQAMYGSKAQVGHVMLYDSLDTSDISAPEFAWGEEIPNFRLLVKRFGRISDNAINGFVLDTQFLNLDPAYFLPSYIKATNCPINYISSMYRFYSGGMRYKVFTHIAPSNVAGEYQYFYASSQIPISSAPADLTSSVLLPGPGNFAHLVYMGINPCLEINCPYQANTPMGVVTQVTSIPQRARMTYAVQMYPQTGTNGKYIVLKAGADDFSFAYPLGTQDIVRIT